MFDVERVTVAFGRDQLLSSKLRSGYIKGLWGFRACESFRATKVGYIRWGYYAYSTKRSLVANRSWVVIVTSMKLAIILDVQSIKKKFKWMFLKRWKCANCESSVVWNTYPSKKYSEFIHIIVCIFNWKSFLFAMLPNQIFIWKNKIPIAQHFKKYSNTYQNIQSQIMRPSANNTREHQTRFESEFHSRAWLKKKNTRKEKGKSPIVKIENSSSFIARCLSTR